MRFWDGNELTAADVAYSLNYNRAPGSLVDFGFASVKNITASGRYTVTVTLTHPDASWQYTPAGIQSQIFEQKFAQAHKGTYGKPGVLVMGTGPWEAVSLDPTKGAELSANPHWWGGKVPIQRIAFSFFSSDTSLALAFRAGELDLDPYILAPPKTFAATSGAKLITAPSPNTGIFNMNTQVPPWNDIHVRRAVAYAINRADIIAANGGYAAPIYTLIPPVMLQTIASQQQVSALIGSVNHYSYNLSKARQEMAHSAYPRGFSTTLLAYSYGSSVNITEAIAAELGKIGIRAQLKVISLTAFTAIQTGPAGKRLPSFATTGGPASPDASGYDWLLGSQNIQAGQWNTADYTPPVVDSLLKAGIATTDPAQRFSVFTKLLQRLATDEPYVPLFAVNETVALSSKFTYPVFGPYTTSGDYALPIKPVS